MLAVSKTHIGYVRSQNQDSLLVLPGLYAVADGMGGHKGGEVASRGALAVMEKALAKRSPSGQNLQQAIGAANSRLFAQAQEDEALSGMGTTLTALWENGDHAIIGHVGDSRLYLLRGDCLFQVTDDHSMVAELMRSGIITKAQAAQHPYRNVITRAVGTAAGVEIDILTHDLLPGDKWLLCSDGLHGCVPEEELKRLMALPELEAAAEQLLQMALEAGGRDNISLILLEKEGDR